MSKEKLIAEIAEAKIRYVIYEQDEKLQYKIFKKKIFTNMGIKKGKILDFNYTSKKIYQDLKNLEKEFNMIFKNITIVINEPEVFCTNLSGFKRLNGSKVEKRDLDYILNYNQQNASAVYRLSIKYKITDDLNLDVSTVYFDPTYLQKGSGMYFQNKSRITANLTYYY